MFRARSRCSGYRGSQRFEIGSTVVPPRGSGTVRRKGACPVAIYRCYCCIWSRPRRSAIVTACVLSFACSLATRFLTWKLTVVSAIANWSAICLLRYPSRMSLSTSNSHRQVILAEMLGQASGNFGRHVPPAAVNRADHCQQVVFGHAFQHVSGGTGPHRSLNLTIGVRGCQHDDTRSRELASNGDKNVGAVRAGELEIHQGHIWLMPAKFSHSLHPIARMSYQPHIRLRCDNGGQTLPENRVVFDAEDSYWRRGAQRNTSWSRF